MGATAPNETHALPTNFCVWGMLFLSVGDGFFFAGGGYFFGGGLFWGVVYSVWGGLIFGGWVILGGGLLCVGCFF